MSIACRFRATGLGLVVPTVLLLIAPAARGQNCVLRWDPQFANPGTNLVVRALEVYNPGGGNRLYAGGAFTSVAGMPTARILSWDDNTWAPLGSGISGGGTPEVFALQNWNGQLYAAGTFQMAGSTPVCRIASWNGTTWADVGGGVSSTIFSLEGTAAASAVGPALYAGGSFNNAGTTGAPNCAGGTTVNGLARWNGTTWAPLGGGMQAVDLTVGTVNALLIHNGLLYAGGAFVRAFNGPGQTNPVTLNYVGRWNGTTWAAMAGGMGPAAPFQANVYALEVFNNRIIAGGNFTVAGGVAANYIASWDTGTQTWSPLGTGTGGAIQNLRQVNALTVWDDLQGAGPALYAGGTFVTAGGMLANYVARWNGTAWSTMSGGMNAATFALKPYQGIDNGLYAGGLFTTAGGRTSERLAKWWCIPLAPEACCLFGAACQDIDFIACQAIGGVAQGPGTSCATSDCPQACCLPDGTCRDVPATTGAGNCASIGGTPQGVGTTCATTSCRQACCMPDNSCQELAGPDCSTAGGTPQGAGSNCATAVCPQACCLPNNSCQNLLPNACAAQGGTSQGTATNCATAVCPQACCLADNSCQDLLPTVCASQGGTAQGLNSNCATAVCPQACCLPNNTCEDLLASVCTGRGGSPQGTGSNCATAECPRACCFSDGSCRHDLLAAACQAMGGVPNAPNSVCTPGLCQQPQACCLPNRSCVEIFVSNCNSQGGTPQGGSTTCASIVRCTGACCLTTNGCNDLLVDECSAVGGNFLGQGTLCATAQASQCPQACCLPNNTCQNVLASICATQGGTAQGSGTHCSTAVCPQACCLPNNTCQNLLPAACSAQGGTAQGVATQCATTVCPQACCLPDRTCQHLLATACATQGGTSNGVGSVCATTECPVACCLQDDSCIYLTATACRAQNGDPHPVGVVCTPDLCRDIRACCCPDFRRFEVRCIDLEVDDCLSFGGTPHGPVGSSCATTPCPWPGCVTGWQGDFGVPGSNSNVWTLITHNEFVYAGGGFSTTGGVTARGVAKWDGCTWRSVGGGIFNAIIKDMLFFDDGGGEMLYASGLIDGAFNIVRFTGTTWSRVGDGFNAEARALAVYNNALYSGGRMTASGATTLRNLARWTGTAWVDVGGGVNSDVEDLATWSGGGGEDLYVSGRFTQAGSITANRIAKWNGTTWSTLGSGLNNWAYVMAVHNDGSGSALYAGGIFGLAGSTELRRIGKWNGSTWSPVGGGMETGTSIRAITSYSGDLFAGGFFSNMGGAAAQNVARWNGSQWSSLNGSGTNNEVLSLHGIGCDNPVGPALYIGGSFSQAGGQPALAFTRWRDCVVSPEGCEIVGPCNCPGDLDGDSARAGDDIQQFIACLLGAGQNCDCGDVNLSGATDVADIPAFVIGLLNSPACP